MEYSQILFYYYLYKEIRKAMGILLFASLLILVNLSNQNIQKQQTCKDGIVRQTFTKNIRQSIRDELDKAFLGWPPIRTENQYKNITNINTLKGRQVTTVQTPQIINIQNLQEFGQKNSITIPQIQVRPLQTIKTYDNANLLIKKPVPLQVLSFPQSSQITNFKDFSPLQSYQTQFSVLTPNAKPSLKSPLIVNNSNSLYSIPIINSIPSQTNRIDTNIINNELIMVPQTSNSNLINYPANIINNKSIITPINNDLNKINTISFPNIQPQTIQVIQTNNQSPIYSQSSFPPVIPIVLKPQNQSLDNSKSSSNHPSNTINYQTVNQSINLNNQSQILLNTQQQYQRQHLIKIIKALQIINKNNIKLKQQQHKLNNNNIVNQTTNNTTNIINKQNNDNKQNIQYHNISIITPSQPINTSINKQYQINNLTSSNVLLSQLLSPSMQLQQLPSKTIFIQPFSNNSMNNNYNSLNNTALQFQNIISNTPIQIINQPTPTNFSNNNVIPNPNSINISSRTVSTVQILPSPQNYIIEVAPTQVNHNSNGVQLSSLLNNQALLSMLYGNTFNTNNNNINNIENNVNTNSNINNNSTISITNTSQTNVPTMISTDNIPQIQIQTNNISSNNMSTNLNSLPQPQSISLSDLLKSNISSDTLQNLTSLLNGILSINNNSQSNSVQSNNNIQQQLINNNGIGFALPSSITSTPNISTPIIYPSPYNRVNVFPIQQLQSPTAALNTLNLSNDIKKAMNITNQSVNQILLKADQYFRNATLIFKKCQSTYQPLSNDINAKLAYNKCQMEYENSKAFYETVLQKYQQYSERKRKIQTINSTPFPIIPNTNPQISNVGLTQSISTLKQNKPLKSDILKPQPVSNSQLPLQLPSISPSAVITPSNVGGFLTSLNFNTLPI